MQRGRSTALSRLAVATMAAAAVSGCGASAGNTRRPRPAANADGVAATATGGNGTPAGRRRATLAGGGTPLSPSAPATLRRGELPRLGESQQVTTRGARLTVTVRRVEDSLRGTGARLPPGTRAVAVTVQIRNAGPKLYDSSATGDIRLQVSGGVVTPVLATRGVCRTPLEDFDRYITAGEDRVGCVVFAVPNGATLDAVWFSPHAHRLGRLTWAP